MRQLKEIHLRIRYLESNALQMAHRAHELWSRSLGLRSNAVILLRSFHGTSRTQNHSKTILVSQRILESISFPRASASASNVSHRMPRVPLVLSPKKPGPQAPADLKDDGRIPRAPLVCNTYRICSKQYDTICIALFRCSCMQ